MMFQTKSIKTIENITLKRRERVKRDGSPYYTWTPGIIASGATTTIYVPSQFPASRKYEPLDFIELTNMESANNLTLTINSTDQFTAPAGVIRNVHQKGLWSVAITNNGSGATTSGNVVASLRREPLTIDKWSRGIRV